MMDGMDKMERGDSSWPMRLADLKNREPKQLWYEGKPDAGIFKKCAAVVGSRRMTQHGRRALEKLVPILVNGGWTVVSGMMYGVDQTAHRLCLEYGGRTIGVLGWGIDYEGVTDSDLRLKKEIIRKSGIIVSEWWKQEGTLWTFPLRDRIIAALVSELYVIEAAAGSGSLITADWGIRLKRNIWAVPGPISSTVSEGTNSLIKKGLARPWLV